MIVSIASQKGGTGKTSTSISLAAGLAGKNRRVLLVDMDSQANSSKVLLHHYPQLAKEQMIYKTILERQPLPIHPTSVPNLSLVPSHILLSNTDVELMTAIDHREARLKSELDKLKSQYDYIFIDNPPALGCIESGIRLSRGLGERAGGDWDLRAMLHGVPHSQGGARWQQERRFCRIPHDCTSCS